MLCAGLIPELTLAQQPPPDSGELSAAAELAQAYIDAFSRRERLEAGNAFLERELERLEAAGEPGSVNEDLLADLQAIDPETSRTLARLLQDNVGPVVQDLNDAVDQLDQRVRDSKAAWLAVRTSLSQGRLLLFKVKGSRQVAGQLASLLSVDKRWFWLFGLVAIATLVGLVFHDRRHELRRLLNGGRARKMGLSKFLMATLIVLAVLTLTTFLVGDRIYEALLTVGLGEEASPRTSMRAKQAALEAEMKQQIEGAVKAFESRTDFKPDVAFDHVFGTEHAVIEQQRAEFLDNLKREGGDA